MQKKLPFSLWVTKGMHFPVYGRLQVSFGALLFFHFQFIIFIQGVTWASFMGCYWIGRWLQMISDYLGNRYRFVEDMKVKQLYCMPVICKLNSQHF